MVLTRRRTGAAGLFALLSAHIMRPNLGSEPFLWERPLGKVSRAFLEGRHGAVREQLDEELQRGVFFKHQYDTESWDFNLMLFEALARNGYRVILVDRDNEAERIFSTFVAMHFGAWHKSNLDHIRRTLAERSETIAWEPAQITRTVRAELGFRRWFDRVYPAFGLETMAISFEQFFRDGIGVLDIADHLFPFAGLGMRSAVLSDESLMKAVTGGDHHSLALMQYAPELREVHALIGQEIARLRTEAVHGQIVTADTPEAMAALSASMDDDPARRVA